LEYVEAGTRRKIKEQEETSEDSKEFERGSMDQMLSKIEKEAYYKTLRAFRIQSNDLSWVINYQFLLLFISLSDLCVFLLETETPALIVHQEKEAVLTNLREQLRISNDVHGELLRNLEFDNALQNAIRQREKPTNHGGDVQDATGNKSPRPRTRRISELVRTILHWKPLQSSQRLNIMQETF